GRPRSSTRRCGLPRPRPGTRWRGSSDASSVQPARRYATGTPANEEEFEMGLMSRAAVIIKAKFSALLNRAENPQETLDYSYEKQLESLQNVKRGVADVVTAKKRLQIQTQQLEQNVVKLDTQAG